jgi:hypothetical protein
MPLDRVQLMQLQEDLDEFTRRANQGDETAARAAQETAIELESYGVKATGVERALRDLVDPRVATLDKTPTRMGFADVPA